MSATLEAIAEPQAPAVLRRSPSASWAVYAAGCIIVALLLVFFVQAGGENNSVFGTYWASGRAASHGLNPYAAYPETFRSDFSHFGGPGSSPDLNFCSPLFLPLFQAASHLPLAGFARAWTATSFLLLIATVALLLWRYPEMQKRQILWLLFAEPTLSTFWGGQIYSLLFLLGAIAWISLDQKREWAAAIAIGLVVAIRPTFLFWPAFLFLRGDRRMALRSVAVTVTASLLPMLFYGPRIYQEWLAAFHGDLHWVAPPDLAIAAFFHRLGLPLLGAALGWMTALLLAGSIWRFKLGRETTSGIAICATVLCAPLAWPSYLLPLAPYLVAHRWRGPMNVAMLMLAIPGKLMTILWFGGPLERAVGSGIYFAPVWIILYCLLSRGLASRLTHKRIGPAAARCWRGDNDRERLTAGEASGIRHGHCKAE